MARSSVELGICAKNRTRKFLVTNWFCKWQWAFGLESGYWTLYNYGFLVLSAFSNDLISDSDPFYVMELIGETDRRYCEYDIRDLSEHNKSIALLKMR